MARYIVSRLIQAVIVVWIVTTFVFLLVRFTPGNAAQVMAGASASQEEIELLEIELGLDKPVLEQYADYMSRVVRGDFRDSLRFREPALGLVIERFPATLKLAALAFLISVGLGGLIGIFSAVRPGGVVDQFGRFFAVLGQSIPTFAIGIFGILIFSVKLGWLPVAGPGDWKHYILPSVTLGWFSMAAMVRLTRSAMLDVLESESVKFLRIKGLPERLVIFKHGLRNAAIPILTLASLQFVAFLSGSVVVEQIFGWPGTGKLLVESVTARDYTVVQAGTFFISVTLVVINLLVDLAYGYIDPRIRYA
ncbi:MAG: ABC transporter permease [Dehalococcoidia bacterium]|nr:ABC transporter permease [Dehalococcoidia bacterium]